MKKNNNMIFTENNLTFHISNEAASGIDTKTIRPYSPNLRDLHESARAVKSQKFFGNVDVSALAKDYPFVPFKYQIENVNAMLNRFEGRGVFGDQVGLGKTVEALMTAHAMFESGAIRNALLIVPEKTKDGWIAEIEEKFPNIFTLNDLTQINSADDIDYLAATFGVMANNKADRNRVDNDIYIITDTILKKRISGLFNALVSIRVSPYKSPLRKSDIEKFSKFEEELNTINLKSLVSEIDNILEKYGYNTLTPFSMLGYNISTEEKLKRTIALLTETKTRVNGIPGKVADTTYKKALIARLDYFINEFEKRKKYFDVQFSKLSDFDLNNIISSAVTPVADPTIDLMIIDEIHSFYESDEGMADTEHITFSGSKTTTMDYIAKIEKKFCILLSATPIRTTLEDIFDLVYLVDSKRFGNTKEEARDYFYNTICNVSANESNPLSKIFRAKSETSRNNFFGLVNNFFTRKHVNEIYADMMGLSRGELPSYAELDRAIGTDLLNSLTSDILQKRRLMFRQSMYLNSVVDELAQTAYLSWVNNTFSTDYDKRRHMRTAIDSAIIDKLKTSGNGEITDRIQRHNAYSAVNWNRRKKTGIAFDINDDDAELEKVCRAVFGSTYSVSQKHAAKTLLLARNLLNMNDSLHKTDSTDFVGFVITSFEDQIKNLETNREIRAFLIDKIVEPFLSGLCYDATLCYLSNATSLDSHSRKQVGQAMAKMFKIEYDKDFFDHKVVIDDHSKEAVGFDNPNQIAIVDERYQAGINYQAYRTFIFAHMDINGKRLLEPVDIEQWIGRIHRTGQVKSCRIITVLTTIMQDESRNPDPQFLRWYYDILADPQGFDLYGDNTPDIAFLQPIIVDILRAKLSDTINTAKEKGLAGSLFKKIRLTNETDCQKFSFSELLECYYHINPSKNKKYILEEIRKLCRVAEFGKALSEN
jgi:hypothetical protein